MPGWSNLGSKGILPTYNSYVILYHWQILRQVLKQEFEVGTKAWGHEVVLLTGLHGLFSYNTQSCQLRVAQSRVSWALPHQPLRKSITDLPLCQSGGDIFFSSGSLFENNSKSVSSWQNTWPENIKCHFSLSALLEWQNNPNYLSN